MKLEDYIRKVDAEIGAHWNSDRYEKEFSESEARVAVVLTRLDTALNATVSGYNAKTLLSIRNALWALVTIGIINLFVK